jgi:hypothetical protein
MEVVGSVFLGFGVHIEGRHWSMAGYGKTDWSAVITAGSLMLVGSVWSNRLSQRRIILRIRFVIELIQ